MRFVHQPAEKREIILFQGLHGTNCSLVFIYRMFCPAYPYFIFNCGFILLKLLFRQVSETINADNGL